MKAFYSSRIVVTHMKQVSMVVKQKGGVKRFVKDGYRTGEQKRDRLYQPPKRTWPRGGGRGATGIGMGWGTSSRTISTAVVRGVDSVTGWEDASGVGFAAGRALAG